MKIRVKRVYEPPSDTDGLRVLVDRLWPRGLTKNEARIDHWAKEIAPSNELRRWYGHDPDKWEQFKQRYGKELDAQPDAVEALREQMGAGTVTFVYGSKATDINNACALKEYLESAKGGKASK